MSDGIKVTQVGMSSLTDRLRDAVRGIEGILRDLDGKVATLRGGFTGEASEAYTFAHARWTAELDEMNALLERHRRSTIESAEIFHDAARQSQQIWS